jgi:VIT1/CCC1 family predicted Fe2+/Mn2+ transporter
LLAVVQRRRLVAAGANAAALSSATATAMAVVWLWAAASLLVTYVFISEEWWQYVLGAGIVGLLCLFFAATLSRDASAGREDATMHLATSRSAS